VADDREELLARAGQQAWIDDPTTGFTPPAEWIAGSLVHPGDGWREVRIVHRTEGERRDVWEYAFTRDSAPEGQATTVPVGIVWDKTNEDARARVYYNKGLFGIREPRRPLVAPEELPLPEEMQRYRDAIRAGDRAALEAVVHPEAQLNSPFGPIERERFITGFSTPDANGRKGVPLQFCTITGVDGGYATEFISWRRPPHGGMSVYLFREGRLFSMRMYEGPVYR